MKKEPIYVEIPIEHKMKIFGVPFLRIDYRIGEK